MTDFLNQLNPQQRRAVESTEGPLLILAGAGSGKTRVITYRIAHLIESLRVQPETILAVTFTNKAAQQMKERVAALLGGSPGDGGPHISTFHSFCVRVLRRDIDRLGYHRDFSIYDEEDQQRLIRMSTQELGLTEELLSARTAQSRISHAKNRGISPADLYRQATDVQTEKLASLYERYEKKLRESNALDFDDLLLKTVELFERAPDICQLYNQFFRYLMVDEYQDTNRIQYRLIRQLTQGHQNICVVGDEDQSIYRWRGADIENILSFEKDYPDARIIRLEQNYRSTQIILDAASAVVSHNQARIGKKLWSERVEGSRVGLYRAEDADAEAAFVADDLVRALAEDPEATIGVLYRTNAQSRLFEEALRRSNTPFQLVGGFRFYERAEIKDALAYARLAVNPKDNAAFLRIINVPARGIGASTLAMLHAAAQQLGLSLWEVVEHELSQGALPPRLRKALESFAAVMRPLMENHASAPLSEFFRNVLDRTGYLAMLEAEGTVEAEGRIENLQELVNAAREAESRGEALSQFLDHAALVSDSDEYSEHSRVTLMTLHTAKGLEFSTVYLVGMEEGLFPHKLSLMEDAALEEERRLCYVGMTRARQRLVLTWAARRRSYGEDYLRSTRPSRFLSEVPPNLLDRLDAEAPIFKTRTSWNNALNSVERIEQFFGQRRPKQSEASQGLGTNAASTPQRWRLGSRVRHPKYGLGTVVDCEGEGQDAKVTVSFPGYGKKKLVERYASLTRA
jgi:DNA helicase-2/ATP-dependent DNA helicase PcrA